MSAPLILDAEALSALSEGVPPVALRALLRSAASGRREVLAATVACAEVCRGAARTHALTAALSRHAESTSQYPAVRLVDTDFDLARQVGAVLHGAQAGTADIVDAHSVALCVPYGGGVIATSDPDDMRRLATAVPAVRIATRPAR